MSSTEELGLSAVAFEIIEHDLIMPFAIAGGGMATALAVITTATLSDGTVGIGESAPFPAVSGETVDSTIEILREFERTTATLTPAERLNYVESTRVLGAFPHAPAAQCGLELAVLDARLRSQGMSVLDWMPPQCRTITSDITLPVGPVDQALGFVADVVSKGFTTLKVKIGGRALREDVDLLVSIHGAFPSLEIVLDANCAYDLATARELLASLASAGIAIPLLEQPLSRESLRDLATLQESTDVLICLDESLKSVEDLDAICQFPSLRSVNFKTMKMGLGPTVVAIERAADRGMVCMIGGMVETRLSMTVSAALAMRYPETIRYVDLDTPFFMRPGPIAGGMVYEGPTISIPDGLLGHGCALVH
ncbi:MAG: enolase C-terminal domain-like protein [Gemmatimonadota bacterium]